MHTGETEAKGRGGDTKTEETGREQADIRFYYAKHQKNHPRNSSLRAINVLGAKGKEGTEEEISSLWHPFRRELHLPQCLFNGERRDRLNGSIYGQNQALHADAACYRAGEIPHTPDRQIIRRLCCRTNSSILLQPDADSRCKPLSRCCCCRLLCCIRHERAQLNIEQKETERRAAVSDDTASTAYGERTNKPCSVVTLSCYSHTRHCSSSTSNRNGSYFRCLPSSPVRTPEPHGMLSLRRRGVCTAQLVASVASGALSPQESPQKGKVQTDERARRVLSNPSREMARPLQRRPTHKP